MLILLPPSESKHQPRRGRPADARRWSFPGLAPVRTQVADALAKVSRSPDAPALLGVSPLLLNDIARNLALNTAPAAPAAQIYTGVLFDALDLASLEADARRRANRSIIVMSALYGALRLTDRIPAYRLAMGVDLPGVGSLARCWRPVLSEVLPPVAGRGLVLDCRSAPYAAAWPVSAELADRWVHVVVPGASHWAKHTRGLVARRVCELGVSARTPQRLAEELSGSFVTALCPPARPGRAWTLEATPRGSAVHDGGGQR
ncbi:MAG: peroxide stress protein YaaA [Tetrasphaera sp.]|nr:peroxide stress protein YaaA [Tetrasphaera sp.]